MVGADRDRADRVPTTPSRTAFADQPQIDREGSARLAGLAFVLVPFGVAVCQVIANGGDISTGGSKNRARPGSKRGLVTCSINPDKIMEPSQQTPPEGESPVADDGSVSRWLDGLKAGDDTDIQRLWDRYFQRLVRLAGARLPGHARRAFDEEDVALSAFHSFCDRAGRGQFPRLADRDDLWRLLVTITARKVIDSVRRQTRQKRGGGLVLGESALIDDDMLDEGMVRFLSREPTPEHAAQFADDYDRLLAKLEDPTLRTIALRKLEGHTSEEIATEFGTSTRTIDRKLYLIRMIWQEEHPG
jgi:DNA-directed RNA polymerase specialized sigma24 family protein